MAKKMFIVAVQNKRTYKLNVEDIKCIHKIAKRPRPTPPSYNREQNLKNWDSLTEVEFEPIVL